MEIDNNQEYTVNLNKFVRNPTSPLIAAISVVVFIGGVSVMMDLSQVKPSDRITLESQMVEADIKLAKQKVNGESFDVVQLYNVEGCPEKKHTEADLRIFYHFKNNYQGKSFKATVPISTTIRNQNLKYSCNIDTEKLFNKK